MAGFLLPFILDISYNKNFIYFIMRESCRCEMAGFLYMRVYREKNLCFYVHFTEAVVAK